MEADITAWVRYLTSKQTFFPQFNNFSAWNKNLFCSPSMQCALHQLGGDGVLDWASGHRQGHLWDADSRVPTCCHRCALQGVFARHHTDRQPEKVSPRGNKWENEPVFSRSRFDSTFCSEHQCWCYKIGINKDLLKGLTATTEHAVFSVQKFETSFNDRQHLQQPADV